MLGEGGRGVTGRKGQSQSRNLDRRTEPEKQHFYTKKPLVQNPFDAYSGSISWAHRGRNKKRRRVPVHLERGVGV